MQDKSINGNDNHGEKKLTSTVDGGAAQCTSSMLTQDGGEEAPKANKHGDA